MASGRVTVEEVGGAKGVLRFGELPEALHGTDPRFAPPVRSWERARLDPRRNPYFDTGDAAYLLARRAGRVVGRIAVHEPHPGAPAAFGFWTCLDDAEVAEVLVEAARSWAAARGGSSLEGPLSFRAGDEPGLLVAGHDVPGCTGRPWAPAHEAHRLEALGAEVVEETATWRLPVLPGGPPAGGPDERPRPTPGPAGPYADPRLVVPGLDAVPDLAPALRGAALGQAWRLARRARAAAWDVAVVVQVHADPAEAVERLRRAAGAAGYREVVAPWAPAGAGAPETRHRRYRFRW